MWKVACAVAAYLLLATAAFAAGSPDCPQWTNAHLNAMQVRAMLCASDADGLEKYFQQRHRDYEAGLIDGGQLLWSYQQLWQPFPYERLTTWLQRYPNSYAAHIAIADELINRAQTVRGGAYAIDTSAEQFAGMSALLRRAEIYLARSLPLSRKPYLTYCHLLRVGRHTRTSFWRSFMIVPRPELRAYLDKAIQLDGPAFIARESYMTSLLTRWGGNLRAMKRHYEDSTNVGLNEVQLGRLKSMVLFEEASLMDPDKHAGARLSLTIEANNRYEDTRFLHDIVWLKLRANRWAEALPELNRALELDPSDEWIRYRRASALFVLERHADAYRDFLILARNGNSFSQNKIGWYLSMGVGVAQNKREGAQWFAKAAAGGDKDGINNLQRAKAEGSI